MDQNNILQMKFSKTKIEQLITVSYFVPEINRNRTEEITEQPHQDFLAALLNLSPFIADVFYASEDKKLLYSATGFKYSSNDKVILTGKVATESGSVVGIATPAINTEEDTYGFEEDLAEAVSTMVLETHALLTGKKVGVKQLTIDDGIKQNEDDQNYSEEKFKEELNEEDKEDDGPPDNDEFQLPE
jgi:hypothetical protein